MTLWKRNLTSEGRGFCRYGRIVVLFVLLLIFHLGLNAQWKFAALHSESCRDREILLRTLSDRPSTVRLLTVNAWLTQTSSTGDQKRERLQLLLENFSSFDVVAVQELPVLALGPYLSATSALQAASFVKRNKLPCHTSFLKTIPLFGWLGQTSGVEIFSRYPIAFERHGIFSAWNWNEVMNNKGWVIADVVVKNGCTVRVVTTQLDAGSGQAVRLAQIEELVKALTDPDLPGGLSTPTVLLGDIDLCSKHAPDCWEYDAILKRLSLVGFVEVFPGKVGTWKEWPMDHVLMSKLALDLGLIKLTTKHLRRFRGGPTDMEASDHLALDVSIEVGPCKSGRPSVNLPSQAG